MLIYLPIVIWIWPEKSWFSELCLRAVFQVLCLLSVCSWKCYQNCLKNVSNLRECLIVSVCLSKATRKPPGRSMKKGSTDSKTYNVLQMEICIYVMWCDVMWCSLMWFNVMWCELFCNVMWCDILQCDVMIWYVLFCCTYIYIYIHICTIQLTWYSLTGSSILGIIWVYSWILLVLLRPPQVGFWRVGIVEIWVLVSSELPSCKDFSIFLGVAVFPFLFSTYVFSIVRIHKCQEETLKQDGFKAAKMLFRSL